MTPKELDTALPYPLDAKDIWSTAKGELHINIPNAGQIYFTMDDLCGARNLMHEQAAQIEILKKLLIEERASFTTAMAAVPVGVVRFPEKDFLKAEKQLMKEYTEAMK